MDKDKLLETIQARTVELKDGRRGLSCPDAFALAGEHEVPLGDIARICNQNRIKFTGCQLGCF